MRWLILGWKAEDPTRTGLLVEGMPRNANPFHWSSAWLGEGHRFDTHRHLVVHTSHVNVDTNRLQ